MLVIEGLRALAAEVRRMPRLVHVGIAVAVGAFALDVLVHLSPAGHDHAVGFRPEHLAHLAGIAAMVLILAGVVIDGARRNRTRRRSSHAHR